MIGAVAIVVPVVFVAGIMARTEPPTSAVELPGTAPSFASHTVTLVEYPAVRIGDGDVAIRILGGSKRVARLAVEFEPEPGAAIVGADLLAYWSETLASGGALPGDASLIGPLGGDRTRRHFLPAGASVKTGYIYVYSEAMKTLIAEPIAIDSTDPVFEELK